MNNKKSRFFPSIKPEEELTPRKRKAKKILADNEIASQRSRLESLLVLQFCAKYGSSKPLSRINTLIIAAIRDYLHIQTDVNPTGIAELEVIIKDLTLKMKKEQAEIRDNMKVFQKKNDISKKQHYFDQTSTSQEESPSFDARQWSVMNAVMAVSDEDAVAKEKQLALAKKHRFKQELDKQLSDIERRKLQEKLDREKYLEDTRRFHYLSLYLYCFHFCTKLT